MAEEIELRHLRDKNGKKIAPFAPEAAIYDEKGMRLSDKLKGLNLNSIREAQDEALSAIDDKENEAIGNFSSQRVIPDMLSPEVMALIEASGGGIINNMPDGEDLTSKDIAGGKSVMQLADRPYNPSAFSGKGYTILRKNVSALSRGGNSNILTRDMISQPNTVYEVRYDFDLNGAEITLPERCILHFSGGCLNNGVIVGNDTLLTGDLSDILDGVKLKGSYKNLECNLTWWGVDTAIGFDNSKKIQDAFDSNIHVIKVSAPYYISHPIFLPYNKVIKGRTGNNNKLTGFYANDNFHSATVDFPKRDDKEAFTQEVYGMFYHRDTTKCEMHDIFIDARHKSDFCVEHIDLYGSVDFYNCYVKGANEVGVLQYGCENPIINQLYTIDCKIGVFISDKKYNRNNIFDFSGEPMGAPNLAHFTSLRCLLNNYGIIINGGSNYALNDLETAYNSIFGIYLRGTTANINNYYIECDGICDFWIDNQGNKSQTSDKGKTLQYLIDNNLDGFPTREADIEYGEIVYYRAPIIIENSNVLFDTAFWSYKTRSNESDNVTNISAPTERTHGGIDSFIIVLANSKIQGKNLTTYGWSQGISKAPDYAAIELSKDVYLPLSMIDLQFNYATNYLQIKVVPSVSMGFDNPIFKIGNEERDNRRIYYSLNRKPHIDYNAIKRLYGVYSDIHIEENQFVETYNNIPLYKFKESNRTGTNRIIYLTKERFNNLVNGRRQLKLVAYVKVLEEVNDKINMQSAFITGDYSYVASNSLDVGVARLIPKGLYRYEMIIDTKIKNSEWEKFQMSISIDKTDTYDKVLLSDMYLYDVDDSDMLVPNNKSYFLKEGIFDKRPTHSPTGFQYFCTDKQTAEGQANGIMIYHKGGDVWVDALGRVVE